MYIFFIKVEFYDIFLINYITKINYSNNNNHSNNYLPLHYKWQFKLNSKC